MNDTTENAALADVPSTGWFASLFQRKPKPPPLKEEPPAWLPQWEKVIDEYPVARQFEYLGRKMVVTRHRHYSPSYGGFPGRIYIRATWPAIIAEYADEHGEIHEHEFGISKWPILANTAVSQPGGKS